MRILRDLKLALRMFRRSPGFALTAVAIMTLGIGLNVAIFSVVNAVLLKPLPFSEPDRLVRVIDTLHGTQSGSGASAAEFMHWRTQSDVLEDVAALRYVGLNFRGGDTPITVTSLQVSAAYFRAFRAPIVRGRGFTPDEDRPGAGKTAVVSYDFWQHHLGGEPRVVGRTVSFSGEPYTVVGVLGPDFDLWALGAPEAWIPLQLDPAAADQAGGLQVVARLKPGVTMAQARAHLEASVGQFRARYPGALPKAAGFGVVSFGGSIVARRVRTELRVLLGAVGFVLLIACANVASLLLVRAGQRRREIAIRSALGASRGRVVLQLLTESGLLSLAGGVLGLGLGFAGVRALLSVGTAGLLPLGPAGGFVGIDWRVVSFTFGLSLATAIVSGLVPAVGAARPNTTIEGSGGSGSGLRQSKARSALVTVEVGLAVALSIGAALLIRTSVALDSVDPGFEVDHILTMRTSLSAARFRTSAAVAQAARTGLERVLAVPGVEDAATTCCLPLQAVHLTNFKVVGRANDRESTQFAGFVTTSGDYFTTFHIPIIRGRAFNDRDDAAGKPVAIISETMARRFWPRDADPLKDRLVIDVSQGSKRASALQEPFRIVGVVGDVRALGLAANPVPILFVRQAQVPNAFTASNAKTFPLAWIVRTTGEPAALAVGIRAALQQATGLPVVNVHSMQDIVSQSLAQERLGMLLMSAFAGAALLLAAIGVYGLMAYTVQQRTQEIGIRMALGAEGGRLEHMVVRQGMLCVAIGVAAGLVTAFYMAHLLAAFLFEVEPHDVAVFATVPVVLTLVAFAALWAPARRAGRVNPADALRHE